MHWLKKQLQAMKGCLEFLFNIKYLSRDAGQNIIRLAEHLMVGVINIDLHPMRSWGNFYCWRADRFRARSSEINSAVPELQVVPALEIIRHRTRGVDGDICVDHKWEWAGSRENRRERGAAGVSRPRRGADQRRRAEDHRSRRRALRDRGVLSRRGNSHLGPSGAVGRRNPDQGPPDANAVVAGRPRPRASLVGQRHLGVSS